MPRWRPASASPNSATASSRIPTILPRIRTSTTRCPVDPTFAAAEHVVLRTSDGTESDSGAIRFPRGTAMPPLNMAGLPERFTDCVRGWDGSAALLNQLARLERLPNLAWLGAEGSR